MKTSALTGTSVQQNTLQTELQVQQAKNFQALLDKGMPLLEKYLTTKMEKIEGPRYTISIKIFGGIILLIILISGLLVYFDKIGGDSFTFLLGAIVGYVMTHLDGVISLDG